MKRAIFIIFTALALVYFYNLVKKNRAYELHQTCVAPLQTQGINPVVNSVREGTAEGFFKAAEAFGSWPSVRGMRDGVFTELGPVDACFAERLYVKAAQLGSKLALNRLESLYDCNFPLNYGVASEAGLAELRKIALDELATAKLSSTIDVSSYSAGSFRCGISHPLSTCQQPDVNSPEYLTKQAILCSGLMEDRSDTTQ